MNHLNISLATFVLLAILVVVSFAQQDNKYRIKGDYLDVPVRAGYRIVGDDKEGFLEDGIIVKTKGTGYVDPRYRKRYEQIGQPQIQPFAAPSQPMMYYITKPMMSSSMMYPKYAVPEIIYGRREW
ncbi:hypothetical protein BLOT_001119 [Blomia tropicalis]|nr:hypothetical protein BLOT_001119 [Blomia tropicalis]